MMFRYIEVPTCGSTGHTIVRFFSGPKCSFSAQPQPTSLDVCRWRRPFSLNSVEWWVLPAQTPPHSQAPSRMEGIQQSSVAGGPETHGAHRQHRADTPACPADKRKMANRGEPARGLATPQQEERASYLPAATAAPLKATLWNLRLLWRPPWLHRPLSNLYLCNSFATIFKSPDTTNDHVMCLGRAREPVHFWEAFKLFAIYTSFCGGGLLAHSPSQKPEDHPVGSPQMRTEYICNYPPHLEAISSIRHMRTHHCVVTRGSHSMQMN
jgi:hypothetical protein